MNSGIVKRFEGLEKCYIKCTQLLLYDSHVFILPFRSLALFYVVWKLYVAIAAAKPNSLIPNKNNNNDNDTLNATTDTYDCGFN